ncbi:MAG: hypothetical protein Q4P32_12595, partial [Micrococcales bacterium]|nr:hypothetical protein [Micrococcales bacterium]
PTQLIHIHHGGRQRNKLRNGHKKQSKKALSKLPTYVHILRMRSSSASTDAFRALRSDRIDATFNRHEVLRKAETHRLVTAATIDGKC